MKEGSAVREWGQKANGGQETWPALQFPRSSTNNLSSPAGQQPPYRNRALWPLKKQGKDLVEAALTSPYATLK